MSNSDVAGVIRLEPDPGLVRSLGARHTLESAIADLVDNCIDASATRISVRLLTGGGRLVQVEVIDDGHGMDDDTADHAMTLGHRREYGTHDLGHFGIGLKAASFGHCDVLTVWSSRPGAPPVGRRIRKADFSRDFSCERLTSGAATLAGAERKQAIGSARGTTVVWSDLSNTYIGANADEAHSWLSRTERKVRAHLGVIFHRLLQRKLLDLDILVDEIDEALDAVGTPVQAVDPFGYAQSGRPGYPKMITASSGGDQVAMQCHVWPAKTDIPGFRILGQSGVDFQGFYIYRNDRLLQLGGWSDVTNRTPQRQLARVVIDDPSAIGTLLTMTPEKAGMRFESRFRDAVARATALDGTTFDEYVQHAEGTYTLANKRRTRRHPVISPSRGFAPAVRRQVEAELGLIRSDQVGVRWVRLDEGEFFDIDFANSELLLNRRYRQLFAPFGGTLNDAPVVKALMFLLTHHIFEGTNLGPKDKDNLAVWRSILGAAVETEDLMRGD